MGFQALSQRIEEIKKRIADLDSGKAKTVAWTKVRQRNLAKLPGAR